jgi:hypothetical protein
MVKLESALLWMESARTTSKFVRKRSFVQSKNEHNLKHSRSPDMHTGVRTVSVRSPFAMSCVVSSVPTKVFLYLFVSYNTIYHNTARF